MKHKISALAVLLALSLFLVVSANANASIVNGLSVPLPLSSSSTSTGSVVFNIERFAVQNGTLVAVGNIVATTTSGATQVISGFAVPVILGNSGTSGSCQILNLVIGPIHLDLLGLVVDVSQITINITAQQGPGNLLGNLLCDIANLLNQNPLNLNQLSVLLNGLLAAL
jgi:hypothetical protein